MTESELVRELIFPQMICGESLVTLPMVLKIKNGNTESKDDICSTEKTEPPSDLAVEMT